MQQAEPRARVRSHSEPFTDNARPSVTTSGHNVQQLALLCRNVGLPAQDGYSVHSHPWPLCQSAGGAQRDAPTRRHNPGTLSQALRGHVQQNGCDSTVQQKQFSHCVCGCCFYIKKMFLPLLFIPFPPPPFHDKS